MYACFLFVAARSFRFAGLQTQPDKARLYNGPLDAMKKIVSRNGVQGLFKGQGVTFTREAVGYGAYFWSYEEFVQRWMKSTGKKRENLPATYAVLFGAGAGYAVCHLLLCDSALSGTAKSHRRRFFHSSGHVSTQSTWSSHDYKQTTGRGRTGSTTVRSTVCGKYGHGKASRDSPAGWAQRSSGA